MSGEQDADAWPRPVAPPRSSGASPSAARERKMARVGRLRNRACDLAQPDLADRSASAIGEPARPSRAVRKMRFGGAVCKTR